MSIVNIITIIMSFLSIALSFLSFQRNEKHDIKKEGKNEGLILSDIGYIKACVDRVEKNMTRIDDSYLGVIERLSKVEETLTNLRKIVDSIRD